MQTKSIVLLLITQLLILTAVYCIDPVCFNCHCSTYQLDNTISCKDAITDKTSYFTLWTRNVSVVERSDVILATEVKSHTEQYCWCTDAKLEWNGLFQNSSGRLLTVQIRNATKTETGHYWAALYLTEKFYFSDPIYLNVTGPEEVIPLPPLKVDPKMGALIVAVLFVVIMCFGISIHCWKMHKRSAREKKRKKERMRLDLELSESRIPLTHWELQHPNNIIQEGSEVEPPGSLVYGPEPRPNSDMEEEGSANTGKSDTSSKESSESLSSEDGKEAALPVKTVVPIRQEATTSSSRIHPTSSPVPTSPLIVVPIKDDRFRTERDWYKSLNTEVVSESLLCNKEQQAKKEEKKRRKTIAAAQESGLAQGILKAGDLGSGLMGSPTHMTQDQLDRINEAHKLMSRNKYKYGRSLPTPQPAGARPTVMGIFPGTVLPGHYPSGATIHITNPNKRRHVRTIFGDYPGDQSNLRDRSRSVQFSNTSVTKRYNSADDLPEPKHKDKKSRGPKKSNLKNHHRLNNKNYIETDGNSLDHYSNHNGSKKRVSSSSSAASEQNIKLDLTPATPEEVEVRVEPPTPVVNANTNRFVVKQVSDSDIETDVAHNKPNTSTDPLNKPTYWDFSAGSASSIDNCGKGTPGSQKKMNLLTVPGLFLPYQDPESGGNSVYANNSVDNNGYWSE